MRGDANAVGFGGDRICAQDHRALGARPHERPAKNPVRAFRMSARSRYLPAMPHYRFVLHGQVDVPDPYGCELPDDAAAQARAARIIRELKVDDRKQSDKWALEVRDGARQVAWIAFGTVE